MRLLFLLLGVVGGVLSVDGTVKDGADYDAAYDSPPDYDEGIGGNFVNPKEAEGIQESVLIAGKLRGKPPRGFREELLGGLPFDVAYDDPAYAYGFGRPHHPFARGPPPPPPYPSLDAYAYGHPFRKPYSQPYNDYDGWRPIIKKPVLPVKKVAAKPVLVATPAIKHGGAPVPPHKDGGVYLKQAGVLAPPHLKPLGSHLPHYQTEFPYPPPYHPEAPHPPHFHEEAHHHPRHYAEFLQAHHNYANPSHQVIPPKFKPLQAVIDPIVKDVGVGHGHGAGHLEPPVKHGHGIIKNLHGYGHGHLDNSVKQGHGLVKDFHGYGHGHLDHPVKHGHGIVKDFNGYGHGHPDHPVNHGHGIVRDLHGYGHGPVVKHAHGLIKAEHGYGHGHGNYVQGAIPVPKHVELPPIYKPLPPLHKHTPFSVQPSLSYGYSYKLVPTFAYSAAILDDHAFGPGHVGDHGYGHRYGVQGYD